MIAVLASKNLPNVEAICGVVDEKSLNSTAALKGKFDLIVASSVCGFLPNYEETLTLLVSMLSPSGLFVQWDWLSTDEDGDFGFSEQQVQTAFEQAGLKPVALNQPFEMSGEQGDMLVLMGVGQVNPTST
jgi:predicted TPR repeat methyltransferase